MEGAKVIETADRFKERGEQQGKPTPDTNARVYYLDDYRNERNEIIELIVEQSASGIAVILDSNGYKTEGDLVLEQARQFAREGVPASEIYAIFNDYLKEAHPGLHRVYRL